MTPNPNDREQQNMDDGIIDASPGPASPRNITETEVWKTSRRGVSRFWTNYKRLLSDSFNRMDRDEQETLIQKFSVIITVGVTILVLLTFYSIIPSFIRLFAVPVGFVAAWWAGRNLVARVVIERMQTKLKRS